MELADSHWSSFDPALPPELAREVPGEESVLIQAAKDGSLEAFGSLVERHQETVFRVCWRWLGNVEDAQEVCQDAFIRAHASMHRYEARASFSTWVLKIAVNRCRDHWRSREVKRRRLTHALTSCRAESLTCRRPAPDASLQSSESAVDLEKRLNALPSRWREPFLLVALEEMSQREAAAILGCSERAIEGRLYRARQALRLQADGAAEKR